jgi:hypothetical protein
VNTRISIFFDITLCISVKFNRHFGEAYRIHLHGDEQANKTYWIARSPLANLVLFRKVLALLAACFMLVSCTAYSSTLKMEAICSSEMSVDFHRTTWRYIPEDRILQNFHHFPQFLQRMSGQYLQTRYYQFPLISLKFTKHDHPLMSFKDK